MALVTNIIGSILDPVDTSKTFSVSLGATTTGTTATLGFSQSSNATYTFPPSTANMFATNAGQTVTSGIWNGNIVGNLYGGTGLDTSGATNGQLLIGNGTGFSLTSLTSGAGITITPGAGTIQISSSGVTSVAGTVNQVTASPSTGSVTLSLPSDLIAPGFLSETSGMIHSIGTVTCTGSGQAGAVLLPYTVNLVFSPAPFLSSIILPTPTRIGQIIYIKGSTSTTNAGISTLLMYPQVGGTIEGLAVDAPIPYSLSQTTRVVAKTLTSWALLQAPLVNGIGTSVSISTIGVTSINNSGILSWTGGSTGFLPNFGGTGNVSLSGTLVAANGGTGFASYTIGDILYANTATTFAKLSDVASGNVLISGGIGAAPSYGKVDLTAAVSGILPIANGGTNSSAILNNNRIMVSSSGTIIESSALTNGQLLIGSSGVLPVSASLTAGTGIIITPGAGSITIASDSSSLVTSFSAGTTGLTPNIPTSGAIVLGGTLIAVNGGTGLSSFTIGDLLYANTTTTLAKLADVATGNVLLSGGIGVVPSYGKVDLTTMVTGTLPVLTGGTGVSTTPTNGQLLIGNGTNYTVATLGTTSGISTTIGAGTLTINNTGVTSLAGTVNQINSSAASGAVTLSISSTFTAPGYIKDTTGLYVSTSATVSAAGATQGTATALTTSYNVVTTVAASTGVVLPVPSVAGFIIDIVNKGANTLNVYPALGGTIDSAGANTAVTLPVGATGSYIASSTTQWYTVNPPTIAGSGVAVTYGNGKTTVATSTAVATQTNSASPTTTTSTTGVMMGIAASVTPTTSGSVLIVISGDIDNSVLNDGAQVQIRTGTGGAPANGAALTGTTQGGLVKFINAGASTMRVPFSLNAVVTGLTLSTAVWVDISLAAITGGTARVRDVSVSIIEVK